MDILLRLAAVTAIALWHQWSGRVCA